MQLIPPFVHAPTQATQALHHSIALLYAALLMSPPRSCSAFRPGFFTFTHAGSRRSVLQALVGQGALAELFAAQKAASDVAAAAASM